MRLCVTLESDAPDQWVPLSHLDLLQNSLDALLPALPNRAHVAFSDLRVPGDRRHIDGERGLLFVGAGTLWWWLASPDDAFLAMLAERLAGDSIFCVGAARFRVVGTATVPVPSLFAGTAGSVSARFSCWTPIVAAAPPGMGDEVRYHRLCPYPAPFLKRVGETLRETLAAHYSIEAGNKAKELCQLAFDTDYLARHRHSGAKRIIVSGEPITGVLAPFVLTAPAAVLRAAWECGIGDRTKSGFGFISRVTAPANAQ